MGLLEQVGAGATTLKRDLITVNITGSKAQYSGSIDMGRTFTLISAQSTTPCRVRLYGDSGSILDGTEKIRPFNSQSTVGATIALISDINLDTSALFELQPPLFGITLDTPISTNVYYIIDTGSASPFTGTNTLTFNRFLMEDTAIAALAGVNTRETLYISQSSLGVNASVTGSFTSPKTYLLYKTEPNFSTARLRLYTSQNARNNTTEYNRAYATEPNSGSGLIADMLLTVTQATPMSPLLVGRNDNDSGSFASLAATSETYFTLTNASAGTINAAVTMSVFSLED